MSPDPAVLLPAFVAGFAVQRIIEIGDAWRVRDRWKEAAVLSLSVVLGFTVVVAGGENMLILRVLGIQGLRWANVDYVVSALVISAGTEGANSIVKFLGYKKDEVAARTRTLTKGAGVDDTRLRLL